MKLLFIFLFSAMTALAQTPEWSRKYHAGSVTCLDFSSDGKMLASGGADSTIKLWNLDKPDTIKTYRDIKAPVTSLDFSSDNTWFLGSCLDSTLSIEKLIFRGDVLLDTTRTQVYQISYVFTESGGGGWTAFTRCYSNSSYLLNDKIVINFLEGQLFNVTYNGIGSWREKTGKVTKCDLELKENPFVFDIKGPYKKTIASQSRSLFFSCAPNGSRLINVLTNTKTYIAEAIENAAFLSMDSGLFISKMNGELHLFSLEGKPLIQISSTVPQTTAITTDVFNRYYISAHADSTLRLWTPGIPNIFKRINLQSPVTTLAVSPDSLHFTTGHTDGTVSFWNIDSLAHYAQTDSVFTPRIISQPKDTIACSAQEIILKTQAISDFGEKLLYRWSLNGKEIIDNVWFSGTQTSELTIKRVSNDVVGTYSAEIYTKKGSVLTNQAKLSIFTSIPLRSQTDTLFTIKAGEKKYLFAKVEGIAPPYFQWYKNGRPIAGNRNECCYIHDINDAQPEKDNGIYTLWYSNSCDTIYIRPIKVEVEKSVFVVEGNPFKNTPTTLSAEPNPFKNSSTIHFSLPKSLKIKIAVTDILGREVAVLKDGFAEIGEQNVVFKNENLPDGIYLITLSGNGLLKTIPVQIIR